MNTSKLHNRIQVRAYYLSQNTGADQLSAWLAAEATELALAAKRSDAARKGAATRARNSRQLLGALASATAVHAAVLQ